MRLPGFKLLLIALAIGALSFHASAQSGRKKAERPAPPIPIASPTPSLEVETVPAKISSLVVGGEVTSKSAFFRSNYLDIVTKEFIFWMKYEPRPFLGVMKGGKMKFEDAKEAAKKETDRHVLWVSASTKDSGYGDLVLDYLDYAILIPRTGRTLINGRLNPGDQRIVAQGGVMKIPSIPRRSSVNMQLKQAARELAFRLKSTSWLGP